MKRFYIFLAVFFIACSVFAQEHLTFKGIPIDGTPNEFIQQLVKKGCKEQKDMSRLPDVRVLSGTFANRAADIYVGYVDNTVCKVVAYFDASESWDKLEQEYFYLKNLYTSKYGEPYVVVEHVEDGYDTSMLKLYGLKEGKVEYYTIYKTDLGSIMIDIYPLGFSAANLAIHYEDAINMMKREQNEIDDI